MTINRPAVGVRDCAKRHLYGPRLTLPRNRADTTGYVDERMMRMDRVSLIVFFMIIFWLFTPIIYV